jgi:hypothetical protein
MRSPEEETTYNRDDHLTKMAEVWDNVMKAYPPTVEDLDEKESR